MGAVTNYSDTGANKLTLIQPPSGSPTTVTYDANGNELLDTDGAHFTTYAWDPENRMASYADTSGSETYAYSADGLRRQKTNANGATVFLWDGQNLLVETSTAGITQARYTDFPGAWGGLTSQHRSGASSFYGFDQQSNTRILTDSTGAVTDSYTDTAFGEEKG